MAVSHQTPAPKGRYIADQWQHGPDWAFYGEGGEDWFGFRGVRALGDREPDILMIPPPGHTLGHCGIAVRGKDKWLLHAGDAYFFPAGCRRSRKCRWCSACFSAAPIWTVRYVCTIRSGCGR